MSHYHTNGDVPDHDRAQDYMSCTGAGCLGVACQGCDMPNVEFAIVVQRGVQSTVLCHVCTMNVWHEPQLLLW